MTMKCSQKKEEKRNMRKTTSTTTKKKKKKKKKECFCLVGLNPTVPLLWVATPRRETFLGGELEFAFERSGQGFNFHYQSRFI